MKHIYGALTIMLGIISYGFRAFFGSFACVWVRCREGRLLLESGSEVDLMIKSWLKLLF